jgi:outer membrane immunogenic protein
MPASRVVVGVEADIQASDINDKFSVFGATVKSDIDWFGTVRGRIGYTLDNNALVYFTGGFAFGGINNQVLVFNKDDTATGYVLGGGYEQKLSQAWSLKAEYQYINLDKNEPEFRGVTLSDVTRGRVKVNDDAFHSVRIGLNYHVAPAYEPLK